MTTKTAVAETAVPIPTGVPLVAPPLERIESNRSIRISMEQRPSSRLSSFGGFKTTCISKHYALNNQILAAFESNYQSQLWEAAYHIGVKFVESALLEIPKHGYFYSDKFADLRLVSTMDSIRVCNMLQEIIARYPTEFGKESLKIEKLNSLSLEQYHNLPTYEETRKRVKREIVKAYPRNSTQQDRTDDSSSVNSLVASTLMACGDSFSAVFCPGGNHTASHDEYRKTFPDDTTTTSFSSTSSRGGRRGGSDYFNRQDRLFPSFSSEERQPEESGGAWPRSGKSMDGTRDDKSSTSLLDQAEAAGSGGEAAYSSLADQYPPFERLSSTGSYVPAAPALERAHSDYDLQRVLFISGLQVTLQNDGVGSSSRREMESISERQPTPGTTGGAKKALLEPSLEVLASCYHEDFDALRQRGRISVHTLPTVQGRVPGSINGCTVIAPLLCIHHFVNDDSIPDRGLPDESIVRVIDEETPNILPKIRDSLGLVQDAFLIPVDAHDALMQQSYMCQEQFLTVCGGNILNEAHLEAFIGELINVGPKKLAATFFFHEHVITILQLRHDSASAWFEVIDSLPHEETFLKVGDTSAKSLGFTGNGSRMDSQCSLGEGLLLDEDLMGLVVDDAAFLPPPDAVRVRCMDAESLKATLMWYACSVFSEDNRAYIDAYEWDENLADFDPRVFQAFVWTEA